MSKKTKKSEEKKEYKPPQADELAQDDLSHVVGGSTDPSEDEPFLPCCGSGTNGY